MCYAYDVTICYIYKHAFFFVDIAQSPKTIRYGEIKMMIVAAIFIICIYLVCPIVGKIALLLANTILPDPLPFVDEFIMWIGLLTHLSRLMDIAEFVRTHKTAVTVGAIALALLLILIIF